MDEEIDNQLEAIAQTFLNLDTLKTRHSDDLDFHDLAVWNVKAALREAFLLGEYQTRSK